MNASYNRIAGQSVERLAALSDGVFAVAMTLLLLELHVPPREAIHSERDLLHAMAAFLPQLAVYLMSFLTLGIFWMGSRPAQSLATLRPEFVLAAPGIFVCGHADAIFQRGCFRSFPNTDRRWWLTGPIFCCWA